jgi:cytochrome c biogenesis protein ResB
MAKCCGHRQLVGTVSLFVSLSLCLFVSLVSTVRQWLAAAGRYKKASTAAAKRV